MEKKPNTRVDKINQKANKLISELIEVKNELTEIQNSSLDFSEKDLENIKKIKEELGLKERTGTWPIDGPGSDACIHCTAGSGA
jgi:cell fate (sporulation/competence/biofilm development) regulator YlbF (YheA/YmcA/DUF963 family)